MVKNLSLMKFIILNMVENLHYNSEMKVNLHSGNLKLKLIKFKNHNGLISHWKDKLLEKYN